ncbi:hypothetical protein [Gloeothece verrucosa]|nr:hypothetical protein [Gloeothece verrucosa]
MVEQQQSIQELEANENHVPCIKIILFLPMLGEQENVAPLLAAINALSFSVDRVLVVPITTEREEVTQLQKEKAVEALVKDLKAGHRGNVFLWKHSSNFATHRLQSWAKDFLTKPQVVENTIKQFIKRPSTKDIIEQVIKEIDFRFPILHIHYPNIHGNKASQMNYALNVLSEQGRITTPDSTYIGVYDADSRPSRLSLIALSIAANKERSAAFQQYPVYLQDTDNLDLFMKNEAWLQTARSVCIEIPRQLQINAELTQGKRYGRTFTYCIGHGEFLRADWLLKAGFPESTPIDDLPTGIMLSLAEQKIVPLPFFDFCSVPNHIFDFIRQSATWFEGQSDYKHPYERAAIYFSSPAKFRHIRGLFEQAMANILWAATGPMRILVLLVTLLTGMWLIAGAIIGFFFLEAWTRWSLTRLLLDSHLYSDDLPRWPFALSSVTRPFLKSVGPCLYLLRKLVASETSGYKTER